MQELVGPGDHAVITVPCYQAMETVTLATGADVSALVPRREDGWALDLDELRALLRPTTKLVAVNFPNNPTGYVPDEATFRELVALVRRARASACSATRSTAASRSIPHARSPRRPISRRPRSRSTSSPSPTACRACASAGSPAATAHSSSASRSVSTTRASATPGRRSTWPPSRSATAGRSGRAPAASSPPTGRCSTASSRAGRTSSTGNRRSAAASASPATRAATLTTSARGCSTQRACSYCRPACTTRRSPTCPPTTSVSESADRASRPAWRPSTASCGARTKFAACGRFGPPLSVTCRPCQRL